MSNLDSAKRVMSGTWGQVWLNGNLVAECYGLQAKRKFNKEKIQLCGSMGVDTKLVSTEGTGTMKLHKVYSRMSAEVGEVVAAGRDPRFTIISKLRDPDAYGAERVAVKNVSFDDETIADWESGKPGAVECPFTFTDSEYLDVVQPR